MEYFHVCLLETYAIFIKPAWGTETVGISSCMYIRSPPTLLFLSNKNGAKKLSILNWAEGNESSSFV